jgi:hypothetical protein
VALVYLAPFRKHRANKIFPDEPGKVEAILSSTEPAGRLHLPVRLRIGRGFPKRTTGFLFVLPGKILYQISSTRYEVRSKKPLIAAVLRVHHTVSPDFIGYYSFFATTQAG